MVVDRGWLNVCKLGAWGMMMVSHVLAIYGVTVQVFTLPILAYGLAVGAEKTSNEKLYLMRVGAAAGGAQILWSRVGLNGCWCNDLVPLWLGLLGALVEKRIPWVGWLAVFSAVALETQWINAVLVMLSYRYKGDLVAWSVFMLGIGCYVAYNHGLGYLVWGVSGPVLGAGVLFKNIKPWVLGRWIYFIYPAHFAGLLALKGMR